MHSTPAAGREGRLLQRCGQFAYGGWWRERSTGKAFAGLFTLRLHRESPTLSVSLSLPFLLNCQHITKVNQDQPLLAPRTLSPGQPSPGWFSSGAMETLEHLTVAAV